VNWFCLFVAPLCARKSPIGWSGGVFPLISTANSALQNLHEKFDQLRVDDAGRFGLRHWFCHCRCKGTIFLACIRWNLDMSDSLPVAPVDRDSLLAHLEKCGFDTVTRDHAPLFTVEDSRNLRGEIEGGHTKNLFLKDKKGNFFLLTAQEDTIVNLKTLHKLLGGASRFSFGSAEKMQELLGVTPGAVTAFGIINDRAGAVKFAIDSRLMEHDKINCHPMSNSATTTMRRDDLLKFATACGHEPQIVDLDAKV
jgi:Ala-tRNA(Pro) deacylase